MVNQADCDSCAGFAMIANHIEMGIYGIEPQVFEAGDRATRFASRIEVPARQENFKVTRPELRSLRQAIASSSLSFVSCSRTA